MMRFGTNLQQRVAITLVGFATITACIVGMAGYWINESTQKHARLATLTAELQNDLDLAGGADHRSRTPILTTYRADLAESDFRKVPLSLQKLQPGFYYEFKMDGRKHSVLIRDVGPARYFMSYDISRLEQRETGVGIGILTIVIVLITMVFFIGTWLARRLVVDVLDFSRRVSTFDPSTRGLRIGDAYQPVEEIDAIAQTFDRYLERLDAYVEREQEFTRTASHELRTPIGTIAGALDVIEGSQEIPAHIQQPLIRIRRATRGLADTVSALLYLAREENEQESGGDVACQVDELISSIIDDHRYLVGNKDLTLQIGELEPTTLRASPTVVIIAISNLVRNAIEHNVAGQVKIDLQNAVFSIQDEGEGISTDQLRGIYRGDLQGSSGGFGYYIINRICKRFGWRMEISSDRLTGTRVDLDMKASCA